MTAAIPSDVARVVIDQLRQALREAQQDADFWRERCHGLERVIRAGTAWLDAPRRVS